MAPEGSRPEDFDPDAFWAAKGTLYLLGTSTGATATSGIVAAFIEDIVETAQGQGRWDQRL